MEGRRESDTFKESFLLRIYSCTDRGGWYILRHRENLYTRVEEELFTHIIFPPLNTFSPNYFFLVGNSVRREICCVYLLFSSLLEEKGSGLNLSYFSYHHPFFFASVQKKGYNIIISLSTSHPPSCFLFLGVKKS